MNTSIQNMIFIIDIDEKELMNHYYEVTYLISNLIYVKTSLFQHYELQSKEI